MEIIRLNEQHCDKICEIENECFAHPWSSQSIMSCIENKGSVLVGAVENGELVGYGSFTAVLDEGYINNIAVKSQFRRNGAAYLILDNMIAAAKQMNLSFLTLEVRVSNAPAISLYEKHGFKNVGVRKNFYCSPNEDAIIMTLYFNGD